ncbi:degenerin mec-4-like [Parasteatoda tepidariorum]|uniref:degenerin mec-4-like n=1 Tax=Parasteatoda tepidariorum TaxID=114398 RepID=UPI0039BCE886
MEYEDYETLMQRLDELIWACIILDGLEKDSLCDLSYYQNVRCPSRSEAIEACWTLNTIIGRPEIEPRKMSSMGEYLMSIRPHLEEYPVTLEVATVHASIHSPRQILNPFTNGFNMDLNTIQTFRLRKVEKKLLPAPYDTNCSDYIEIWKLRGGHGPTNQKECFEECQKNISLKYRGCFANYYKIPGNEKICSDKDLRVTVPENKIAECENEHCFPACFEESYEVTREITNKQLVKTHPNCPHQPVGYQFIDVMVNMNGMETTTYTYSPKYQNIEIFSYIGGYVGMWLGISLVAVFDFLETVILIMSYPVKSYKKARKRNRRIEDIKMLRRDL